MQVDGFCQNYEKYAGKNDRRVIDEPDACQSKISAYSPARDESESVTFICISAYSLGVNESKQPLFI